MALTRYAIKALPRLGTSLVLSQDATISFIVRLQITLIYVIAIITSA